MERNRTCDIFFVYKVQLEGEWVELCPEGGGMRRSEGMRRFQGMGKSTREGRMAAAEAALSKLRGMMPGLDLPAGVIPKDWERYVIFFHLVLELTW